MLTMCHSNKLLQNDALANLLTLFINTDRVHYPELMRDHAITGGSFNIAAPRASFFGQFIIALLRFGCPRKRFKSKLIQRKKVKFQICLLCLMFKTLA